MLFQFLGCICNYSGSDCHNCLPLSVIGNKENLVICHEDWIGKEIRSELEETLSKK